MADELYTLPHPYRWSDDEQYPPVDETGKYYSGEYYYWLNADQTRMIIFSSTSGYVTNISVYDEIPEGYLRFINN